MDLRIRRMYPSQCNKIEQGLYLGNLDAAEQIETLRHLRITHILTVASFPLKQSKSHDDIKSLFIDAEDWDDENLLSSFPKAIEFIKEGQQNGACLVHCLAGISRSATVVIAFLMQKYDLPFLEAFKRVEEKRPCINPNDGFIDQLKLFEVMKWTIDTENLGYKVFSLHHLAKRIQDHNLNFLHEYLEEFKGNTLRGKQFKCRKCRQYLFCEGNVIPHFQGLDLHGTDPQLQCCDINESSLCKSSLLVEPMFWMVDDFQSLEGKLYCPKCKGKVGTFYWTGDRCVCGAFAEPYFKICESKVDKCY